MSRRDPLARRRDLVQMHAPKLLRDRSHPLGLVRCKIIQRQRGPIRRRGLRDRPRNPPSIEGLPAGLGDLPQRVGVPGRDKDLSRARGPPPRRKRLEERGESGEPAGYALPAAPDDRRHRKAVARIPDRRRQHLGERQDAELLVQRSPRIHAPGHGHRTPAQLRHPITPGEVGCGRGGAERPEPFSPCNAVPSHTSANASEPIPFPVGSTSVSVAAIATAASTADPPRAIIDSPACAASGCEHATAWRAHTGTRRDGYGSAFRSISPAYHGCMLAASEHAAGADRDNPRPYLHTPAHARTRLRCSHSGQEPLLWRLSIRILRSRPRGPILASDEHGQARTPSSIHDPTVHRRGSRQAHNALPRPTDRSAGSYGPMSKCCLTTRSMRGQMGTTTRAAHGGSCGAGRRTGWASAWSARSARRLGRPHGVRNSVLGGLTMPTKRTKPTREIPDDVPFTAKMPGGRTLVLLIPAKWCGNGRQRRGAVQARGPRD